MPPAQRVEGPAELRDKVEVEPLVAIAEQVGEMCFNDALDLGRARAAGLRAQHFHLVFVGQQEIHHHPGAVARWEGVALQRRARRRGQFSLDASILQQHFVETDAAALGGFVEPRTVTGAVQPRLGAQGTERRHHAQAAHRPFVNVAEAIDVFVRVFVPSDPALLLVVRGQLHHTKRHPRPRRDHPARMGRALEHVHVIGGRDRRARRETQPRFGQ